jgi:ATP-dependent RNA helicase RhlE
MKLKKINENLLEALIENGLTEANEMQEKTFSTFKSGADCIVIAPNGSGKSTTIVLNVIQKLSGTVEESPRALIFVEDKVKVLEMVALFEKLGKNSGLEVYGVGTPTKLSDMFTTAGFNVNRLRMFIIDDTDSILKLRHETKIMRISNSISKTQRIIFSDVYSERIEILADKMLLEPVEFDFEEEEMNDQEEE